MTTTSSDPKSILVRFAVGAIPAAAAVILILWHALRPIVGPDHQGFVFIAAGAEHRAPALEACRWMIDELKERVPIWKKETTPQGESWVTPHP